MISTDGWALEHALRIARQYKQTVQWQTSDGVGVSVTSVTPEGTISESPVSGIPQPLQNKEKA